MYYTQRAQTLLAIDNMHLNNPEKYLDLFAANVSAEAILPLSQRSHYQQLKQVYMGARQQFREKRNDETAMRLLKAHEDLSTFRKSAGFKFESSQAFYEHTVFQYAELLLKIEQFFKEESGKYEPFSKLMIKNEDELIPEQKLNYTSLKTVYENARQRFSIEKNRDNARAFYAAHQAYSAFKEEAGFDYKSLKKYYETMLVTGWRQVIRFSESAGPTAKRMRMNNG